MRISDIESVLTQARETLKDTREMAESIEEIDQYGYDVANSEGLATKQKELLREYLLLLDSVKQLTRRSGNIAVERPDYHPDRSAFTVEQATDDETTITVSYDRQAGVDVDILIVRENKDGKVTENTVNKSSLSEITKTGTDPVSRVEITCMQEDTAKRVGMQNWQDIGMQMDNIDMSQYQLQTPDGIDGTELLSDLKREQTINWYFELPLDSTDSQIA